MTRVDSTFARDVAKQLDRRRIRRRLVVWSGLLAAIAAAVMYLRCGAGFGLGGAGKGAGAGGEAKPVAEPVAKPCVLRVEPGKITVDAKPMLRDEAIAACQAAGGAELVIPGDTPHGEAQAVRDALRAANIAVHERNRVVE